MTPTIDPVRMIVYQFLGLSFVAQRKIVRELELLEDGDNKLSDAEMFTACFKRARDRIQLESLWEKTEAAHGRKTTKNPFEGQ